MRLVIMPLLMLLAALLPTSLPAAPNIQPALIAETASPSAGSTITIAVEMTPAPGWHGYWKNPGDAGMETEVRWTLPDGVAVTPFTYPVPERLTVAGLMNYVYSHPYAMMAQLSVPANLAPGSALPLRATLNWLECTDVICVPASAEIATTLTVGDGRVNTASRARFDRWRAAEPRPLGSQGYYERAGDRIRLALPLPADILVEAPYLFPLTDGAIAYSAQQSFSRSEDMLIVEVPAADGFAEAGISTITGVLSLGDKAELPGLSFTATPGPVPAAGTSLEATAGGSVILVALGAAILGGLLLNIMPCVFPILSRKALSLARSGESERAARREALAYAAGVILVCLALGGLLLTLRAGGDAIGWAFQLQDPRVILLLLLLTTAIGLNLAGLFELEAIGGGGKLAGKGGAQGAFWTGALAAFIATPCTGPFMGAALGSALVLPPVAALAVFGGLGLGLALPFLILGFVPATRRLLPRPGPWMDTFRHVLAVPMLLTALGLAWILGRQAGVEGMTLGLAATLVVGLGLWWVGRRQRRSTHRRWWPLAPALALAGLALGSITPQATDGAVAISDNGGIPFDEARLAELRAAGKPVFVYFTADWCLTCKVNEKTAIDRDAVRNAFRRGGVTVMVGDWTRGDPDIGRFLAANGRSGVPLYLFYGSNRPVEVLPQVLTPGALIALAG